MHLATGTIFLVLLLSIASANSLQTKGNLVVINEDNWTDLLKGEWFVDFYAPWCHVCQTLKPEWDKLVDWSADLNIKVASADVTEQPGLSGRFMVGGLPTIYHVKDGLFRVYNGPRVLNSFVSFVEEQKWKAVEPVSRFWSPESLQMSALAHLFKASMKLRDIHNQMTETYGLPYYVSYILFALSTVTLGTILGLMIVFIVDLFCPARHTSSQGSVGDQPNVPARRKKVADKKNDSDLDDSDIVESTPASQASETKTVRKRTRG